MLKRISGKWVKQSNGEYRGEVGTGLRALALDGDETDTNYEVGAKITVVKGTKVSIVAFYVDGNYLEMVLDVANDQILLDKMVSSQRTNIETVSYVLETGKVYDCQLIADSDKNVKCAIDGALIIQTTLGEQDEFTAGQHGFACDGTVATDYSVFNEVYLQKEEYYVYVKDAISDLSSIDYRDVVGKNGTLQDHYDYLIRLIDQVCRFFDNATNHDSGFFKNAGLTVTEYFDGKGSTPPVNSEFAESIKAWKQNAASFLLGQRPPLSVTSVHENKAEIGATDDWQEITAYRLRKNAVVVSSGSIPVEGVSNVRVIYKAGYTKTPSDVRNACSQLIYNYVKALIASKSAAFISFQRPQAVNFASPDVLTPDIRQTIAKYAQTSFGEM